jgi:hypothetical protein
MTSNQLCRLHAPATFAFAVATLVAITFSTSARAQSGTPATSVDQSPQVASPAVELSRSPYQQYLFAGCPTGQDCTVTFSKVPSSSRLEITNVSCFIEVFTTGTDEQELRGVQLWVVRHATGAVVTASTLVPIKVTRARWAINHPVSVFANAGQAFEVFVDVLSATDSVQLMACHISGQMVKLG